MIREVDEDSVKIINTDEEKVVSEKVELEIEKKWINLEEDIPVENIEIEVLKNGNYYLTENISKENNWRLTIKDLDKYEKIGEELKEIEYSVVEAPILGFTSEISDIDNKFIIENKKIEQTSIDIPIKKLWEFKNGEVIPEKLIPNFITLDLLANDTLIASETFKKNKDGKFDMIFENMPKFDEEGNTINYTIKERGLENFEKTISGNQNDGFILKNILNEEELVDLKVKKIWHNKNNEEIDGQNILLPNRVGVEVLADKEAYLVGILSKNNNWFMNFENLPKYNKLGEEIEYSVNEVSLGEEIIDDNSYTIKGNIDDGFIITNKIELTEPTPPEDKETIEINIEKKWQIGEEEANIEDIPDIDITVQIIGDGIVLREDSLNKETDWELTVKDLPKFNENKEEISYDVKELNWDKKSEVTKDGNIFYITNYLDSEEERPEEPEEPEEKISIDINKSWKDKQGNERKNIPVDKVYMQLYADGVFLKDFQVSRDNDWMLTIDGLNKFNKNKELIKYEIKEADFNGEVIEISNGKFEVINTIDKPEVERETKSIEVEKIWKNEEGQSLETIPVSRVRVEILRNEKPYLIVLLNDSNKWKVKVDNLYLKDKNGNDYVYSVKELPFETTININSETEYIKEENNYTVINKIKDFNKPNETIDIPVEKTWIDKSGVEIDGINENYIQLKLLRNDEHYLTGLLSKEKGWKGSFKNLKKNDTKGNPYKYTIEEVPILGYSSNIEGDMDKGYKVINKKIDIEKRNISVKKKWVSSIGDDNMPEYIYINLYKDGEFLRTGRLLKSNNWEGSFKNLDRYKKGEHGQRIEIIYSIKEIEQEGYDSIISGDFRKGYEIYNVEESSLIDEDLINIPVKKIWNGSSESSATIILYADGSEVNRVILTNEKLEHTFKNLPKYDNDNKVEYTIEEVELPGYKQSISGNKKDGFIVTNTKIEEPETEHPEYPGPGEKPERPEKPEKPEKPEEPEEPEKPEEPNGNDKDEDNINDNSNVGKNEENSNNILPKTGYQSSFIFEVLGIFLIILGLVNYTKKKNK